MALSFAVLTSGSSTDNVAAYTTASTTPTAGKLYVLIALVSGTNPAPDFTIAGNGLTWEQAATTTFVARGLKTYVAKGTPTAGAITITSVGAAYTGAAWWLLEVSGADLTGANALAALRQTKAARGTATTGPPLALPFDTAVTPGDGALAAVGISLAEAIAVGTGWTAGGPTVTVTSPTSALLAMLAPNSVQSIDANWTSADTAVVNAIEIKAVPAAQPGPTVSAGADATGRTAGEVFTRTATENDNGSAITARAWTIVSGPTGAGTTIGTAAALSWTPTTAGTYVLRYSATNAGGTGSDDMSLEVVAAAVGVSNIRLGESLVKAIYLGTTPVQRAYLGTTLVWSAGAVADPEPNPVPPPSASAGILLSAAEIAALPTSGAGWDAVMARVNTPYGGAYAMGIRDDSNKDVLAHALAGARLNSTSYKTFVRDKIALMMSKGRDTNDVLSTLRNLQAYIIGADLIALRSFDPALDSQFRTWLNAEIRFVYAGGGGGGSVIGTHDKKPNNFGTHAGACRVAAALYLGDTAEFNRARDVWQGWATGEPTLIPAGYAWKPTNWHHNSARKRGINEAGASRDGNSFDGVIPEDQERAGEYTGVWPPVSTNYIHGATDGMTLAFWMMARKGVDCWNWANQAAKRQMVWKQTVGGSQPYSGFRWQVPVIEKIYGLSWADHDPAGTSTNFGYADWWAQ